MVEFSSYYINFIRNLFENIGNFFKRLFEAFADLFFNDVVKYFNQFFDHSQFFNVLDWLIAIFVFIVTLAFLTFLGIRLYQFIRKYIRFAKKEIEKDVLLEEVAILSQKAVELTEEKQNITIKMESFRLNRSFCG